jgi:hypothetical protein
MLRLVEYPVGNIVTTLLLVLAELSLTGMKTITILIISILMMAGCAKRPDVPISTIDFSGREIHVLNIEKIKDSIELNLTDIADNLHFIHLETN